jgi:hypothetical protein
MYVARACPFALALRCDRFMPFQNAGTVLENLVVLAAARTLRRRTRPTDGPLDFASAFAMPPFSPWRHAEKYAHEATLAPAVLDRLRAAGAADLDAPPTSYPQLMRRCLRHRPDDGPNGALLVALLTQLGGGRLRMWLNDLPDDAARYGATLGPLDAIGTAADACCLRSRPDVPGAVATTGTAYPASLDHLAATLTDWSAQETPRARLGFLDPNAYFAEGKDGPHTARPDHRTWLMHLAGAGSGGAPRAVPTVSVHFLAKRSAPERTADLQRLAEDGTAAGYAAARAYVHRHYALAVNLHGPDAAGCADALDTAVADAWRTWYRVAVRRKDGPAPLRLFIDGTETDAPLC